MCLRFNLLVKYKKNWVFAHYSAIVLNCRLLFRLLNLKILFQVKKEIFFSEELDDIYFGDVGVGQKVSQIYSQALS